MDYILKSADLHYLVQQSGAEFFPQHVLLSVGIFFCTALHRAQSARRNDKSSESQRRERHSERAQSLDCFKSRPT